jgi:UDP-glucuronate 4-epimerase
MKILVTGVAGFIGFFLSKKLLENGFDVFGIDNLNDYYDVNLKESRLKLLNKYENFNFDKCDISDKPKVTTLFEEKDFEVVINLAAQAGVRYSIEEPDEYIQSNIVGFFNIIEACRHNNIKHLLYASSSSVYGMNKKAPFSTSDFVDNPVSLYAATKKSNELMAHSYSHLYRIPATGLRFFTVYGPFGRPDMAYFKFTKAILEGNAIDIYNRGDMIRDFTYIDDIVESVYRLIKKGFEDSKETVPHRVFNIGNNEPVKLGHFIKVIESELGVEAKKNYLPMQDGDVQMTYADIDPLIKEVNFKPETSIETGLKSFIEWYKEYYKER